MTTDHVGEGQDDQGRGEGEERRGWEREGEGRGEEFVFQNRLASVTILKIGHVL